MHWWERRYSPWLLKQEEGLMRRRDGMARVTIVLGAGIALLEALLPWDRQAGGLGPFTPDIAPLLHIAVAALILPVLYFLLQADFRHKLQAFSVAMSDRGRRLLFLDIYLDSELFEVQERMQGAVLMPTQRAIDTALKLTGGQSLSTRVHDYYKSLPATTYEGDRLGLLSIGHPRTAISWGIALALAWALCPPILPLPLMGVSIGTSQGLSVLPMLLLVYLYAARANTRFAFETALYNWLRLG